MINYHFCKFDRFRSATRSRSQTNAYLFMMLRKKLAIDERRTSVVTAISGECLSASEPAVGNPMKASRPIGSAGHSGALSPSDVEELLPCLRGGASGHHVDGCVLTTVPWRTVKSARAMQIYRVTVNTAAEHIIHSGAYLAERVHAFTLGATDGRGSSYRILGHTDAARHVVVCTHARTYVRTHARNAVLCYSAPQQTVYLREY